MRGMGFLVLLAGSATGALGGRMTSAEAGSRRPPCAIFVRDWGYLVACHGRSRSEIKGRAILSCIPIFRKTLLQAFGDATEFLTARDLDAPGLSGRSEA